MNKKKSLRVLVLALAAIMVFGVMTTAFAQDDGYPGYNWNGRFPQVSQGGGVKSSVRLIQHYYNTRHYGYLAEDGVFGASTLSAVLVIQSNLSLLKDGIVGSDTWERMQSTTAITMWGSDGAYHGSPRWNGGYHDAQAFHKYTGTWSAIANGGQAYTIV